MRLAFVRRPFLLSMGGQKIMKISILTVFPELHEQFLASSLIARAQEKGLIECSVIRFSDMCQPKERIDEPTCGHGVGMIIKPEVIARAIESAEAKWGSGFTIFFSPQGTTLTQKKIQILAQKFFATNEEQAAVPDQADVQKNAAEPHIILVCSRYEGVDARVEAFYADLVLSIGDYVLMGGDIPAQVFMEALLRYLPGVVGKQESVESDSFTGPLLDFPEYGLPVEWNGLQVPEVVRSGNHGQIDQWRREQAYSKTILNRFDWFISQPLADADKKQALEVIPPHYLVLMHSDVYVKADGSKVKGTTSIASIDIHDLARSCATYGIKNFFLVSPLVDQKAILKTFMDFWMSDVGKRYNQTRFDALMRLVPASNFDEVIAQITAIEGVAPVVVTTSAKNYPHKKLIDYTSQGTVWKHRRPVLFVFGTGQGLCDELMERSDFVLLPLKGLTAYNHLSVRGATAIILDRWLGTREVLPRLGDYE